MKYLIFFLLLFTVSATIASDSIPKKKYYKVQVTNASNAIFNGYLKDISNDHLVYTNKQEQFGATPTSTDKFILSNELISVKVKKKGSVGRGALYGGLIGFATGALMGFIEGDDKIAPYTGDPLGDIFIGIGNAFAMTAGEKAMTYGLAAGGGGAIAGVIIGAVARKKFIIGGNRNNFESMKIDVLQKVYGRPIETTSITK